MENNNQYQNYLVKIKPVDFFDEHSYPYNILGYLWEESLYQRLRSFFNKNQSFILETHVKNYTPRYSSSDYEFNHLKTTGLILWLKSLILEIESDGNRFFADMLPLIINTIDEEHIIDADENGIRTTKTMSYDEKVEFTMFILKHTLDLVKSTYQKGVNRCDIDHFGLSLNGKYIKSDIIQTALCYEPNELSSLEEIEIMIPLNQQDSYVLDKKFLYNNLFKAYLNKEEVKFLTFERIKKLDN
jgi:hypothetical protein